MWNNAYLLALMTMGCTIAAGLSIGIIEVIFDTRISGLGFLIQLLSAFIIGGCYSQKQQSLIPKGLKLWTSMYYALISFLMAPITLNLLNIHIPRAASIWNVIGIVSILGFIFAYWGLSFGSKQYMKRVR